MKKIFMILALLSAGVGMSNAETASDGWALGFGLSYPRYYSVNIDALNSNYGGYISIQRNFTEHVGLRLKAGYSHMEGQWLNGPVNSLVTEGTNLITADLDLLYYVIPCELISPYIFAGAGGNYKMISGAETAIPDADKPGVQLNAGLGVEVKLNPEWNVTGEFGYHITANSALDGDIVAAELNGYDSYLVFSAGVNYLFSQGSPSEQCGPCKTGSAEIDYGKIEDLIIKNMSRQPVVDSYIVKISDDRLLLVGVKFAFDKSSLLPESYGVLDQAVKLLNTKPEVKVEIEGYTDYVGTGSYNQKLSLERAETVKTYLVSKGVDEARLTTIGYGMNNPLEDNKTPEGRAMNRRIVFRILK